MYDTLSISPLQSLAGGLADRLQNELTAASQMAATLGSADDATAHEVDEIVIPKRNQEVTVIGEVQSATSHLYRGELERDDYIALSGGMTRLADGKKTYVVHANGSVDADTTHWRVPHTGTSPIRPGDTVVVPLDTTRLPSLSTWQAVTTTLYNIAIAVAAAHSFK